MATAYCESVATCRKARKDLIPNQNEAFSVPTTLCGPLREAPCRLSVAGLEAVVLDAQHLAVLRRRLATRVPWLDVIRLHALERKGLFAHWTDPLLPCVCGPLL